MDIGQMNEEQRMTAYIRALTPSVYQKYRVRKVFGSQRHCRIRFRTRSAGAGRLG
jgi:hypothetical protein